MNIINRVLVLIGIVAISGILVFGTRSESDNAPIKGGNDYNVYALDIPKKLDFAGEAVSYTHLTLPTTPYV